MTITSVRDIDEKRGTGGSQNVAGFVRIRLPASTKPLAAVAAELADGVDFAATRSAGPHFLNGGLLLLVLSLVAFDKTYKLPGLHVVGVDPEDLADGDQRLFTFSFLIERDSRGHEVFGLNLKLLNSLQLHQPLRGVLDECLNLRILGKLVSNLRQIVRAQVVLFLIQILLDLRNGTRLDLRIL